ncbi:MAG TPA: hypothetical protein VH062_12635 [Polyangiaceae bacterium]|jgi:hypothetical protein|nr:hypothetical protein [Polyangiaceae bacterium]
MKPRFLIAAMALAYASHAPTTYAQAFLSDARLVEGQGVKTGNFELHPGIAAEGGYDSNYFQAAGVNAKVPALPADGVAPRTVTVDEPVLDAFRLRITPSLSLQSRGARAGAEGGGALPPLTLNAHISASYSALFPAGDGSSSKLSNQDDVAATAGFMLNIFPGRTWGGDISADYNRVIEASNDPDTANAFKRDNIRGGAGISFRPGGGLFSYRLGYQANATIFESHDFTILDNIKHTLQLAGSWKFLPRTALLYRGNVSWLRYTDSNSPATLGDGETIDSEIGLNGLISNYFGLLGMIGWAGTFYTPKSGPTQNYDSAIGQAQITWYPSPQNSLPVGGVQPAGLSSVALGYTRNFASSYLGTFYQRDRGYASIAYFFGERFVLSLTGGLSHITRPPTFFAAPAGSTTALPQANGEEENRVDAVAFLEYRVAATVGINATFRYDAELEHRVYALAPGPGDGGGDDLYFKRYQVYLGVRWFL